MTTHLDYGCHVAGYLDAVGAAVVMACGCIPSGLLCFFPSWSLLNSCRDRWLLTGMLSCMHNQLWLTYAAVSAVQFTFVFSCAADNAVLRVTVFVPGLQLYS